MFCSASCVDVRGGQSERKRCDQVLGNPSRFLGNTFLFVLMTLLLVNLYRNISLLFAKIYHSFWQVVFNEKIWCLIGFYFQMDVESCGNYAVVSEVMWKYCNKDCGKNPKAGGK